MPRKKTRLPGTVPQRREDLKQRILETMRGKAYSPLSAEELASLLKVTSLPHLTLLLSQLEAEGQVVRTRKKRYGLPEKMGLAVGRLQAHPRGFGFLVQDQPGTDDIYIEAANMGGAMHNDRVVARLLAGLAPTRRGRPEGEVIRVLQRANQRVVGRLEKNHMVFVVPDDRRLTQDILVAGDDLGGAEDGDKVVVEITRWPEGRRNPEGRVVEALGRQGNPGVDILSLIRKYDLPELFPRGTEREAEMIQEPLGEEDLAGRRDLRNLRMVTIDGEDAKDLDDAVSLEKLPGGGFLLGVHIADVGYYVKEGGELDREAFLRGTSVYLVDRVIPMLPPKLSNGICSLNAGEDRLTLSVLVQLDAKGVVISSEIFPSVIRVRERMTYKAVRLILEGDMQIREHYHEHVEDFRLMASLAELLRQQRLARGSVDFDFPESKVKLDEKGRTVDIIKLERSIAERIIEEFMILANEVIAAWALEKGIPFVFRVHEEPAPDSVQSVNEFLHTLGYHVKGEGKAVKPAAYQEVAHLVHGKPEEQVVNIMLLRSMKHARYDTNWLGHFGMASPGYSHFTSPIRRYPDLVIHRLIREFWEKGKPTGRRLAKLREYVALSATQSSMREKVAEEAERESVDMKKVEYMAQFVGQDFSGTISGVTSFGFFVALENTVEGLVHVSSLLDDYYIFQETQMALVGRHTAKTYRLGDTVKIVLSRVDVTTRQVDFDLARE